MLALGPKEYGMDNIRNYSHHDQIIPDCMKYLPNPYEFVGNSFAVDFITMPKMSPLIRKTVPAQQLEVVYKAYFKLMVNPDTGASGWVFDKFSDNFTTNVHAIAGEPH